MVVNRGQTGFFYQAKLHGLHRQKTYAPGAPKRIRASELLIAHQTNVGDPKNIKDFQILATDLDPLLSTLNYQLSALNSRPPAFLSPLHPSQFPISNFEIRNVAHSSPLSTPHYDLCH